jgi:hypothetical protein
MRLELLWESKDGTDGLAKALGSAILTPDFWLLTSDS